MDSALILVIILIVAIVLRGPKTLPQLGAMLGRGVKQARRQLGSPKDETGDGNGPA